MRRCKLPLLITLLVLLNPLSVYSQLNGSIIDSELSLYKNNLEKTFNFDSARAVEVKKEPVQVHFTVNTSMMPDTLRDNHFMQLRGGFVGPDVTGVAGNGTITWDSRSLGMYPEGGDYWSADFLMSPGDTLYYKFWAGIDVETPLINGSEKGWESGSNNVFILPSNFARVDTIVDLQFYETRKAPYPVSEDSISIFFRVNMGPQIKDGNFDPATDTVGVIGYFDGNGNRPGTIILEPGIKQGENYFYKGIKRISRGEAELLNVIGWVFMTIHEGTRVYESNPGYRNFEMPVNDTTLHWDYYDKIEFKKRVYFTVNTSTMPDTLRDYHFMQLRGSFVGPNKGAITWDSKSLSMYPEGGDYWSANFLMSPGDTLNYKFWAGVDAETPLINGSEKGYESGSNNVFILPSNFARVDTIVDVQFYETRQAPYPITDDSISIFFRVNMGPQIKSGKFDPSKGHVYMRSSFPDYRHNLKPGANQGDNYFYEGTRRVSPEKQAQHDYIIYEFAYWQDHIDYRESVSVEYRQFDMPAKDTTLHWDYYNREGFPPDNTGSVAVTFTVNMATLLDTLQEHHTVQLKGAPSGEDAAETGLDEIITWDSGSLQMDHINGDIWGATFDMSPGDTLDYKFWAGVDIETPLINGQEQGWESGANNQFVLPATASVDTLVPMQWYENREPPYAQIDDTLTIFFKVNMGGPIQTGDYNPETDKVGVRGNPVFFDNPTDWSSSAFYLDQAGGSGDNIFYTGIAQMHRDSAALIEEEVAYKFVFEVDGVTTWESRDNRLMNIPEKDLTLKWVHFNDTPPSDNSATSSKLNEAIIRKFTLEQNFPNPFNPSTQIRYALPEATEVTLEVFNSLGQKVIELVNGQKSAGYHTATFDASGLSSGVYLYKLTTPSFTQTKKMLLIK